MRHDEPTKYDIQASQFMARAGLDGWRYKPENDYEAYAEDRNIVLINPKIIGTTHRDIEAPAGYRLE